jgi:hypothetical protein
MNNVGSDTERSAERVQGSVHAKAQKYWTARSEPLSAIFTGKSLRATAMDLLDEILRQAIRPLWVTELA